MNHRLTGFALACLVAARKSPSSNVGRMMARDRGDRGHGSMRHTSDAMDAGLTAMLPQGERIRVHCQPICSWLITCVVGVGMIALLLTLLLAACAGPTGPVALPPAQSAATGAPAPTLTSTFASTPAGETANTPATPARELRPPITAGLLTEGLSIIGAGSPLSVAIPSQAPPATITPVVQTDTAIFQQAQSLFRASPSGFVEEFSQTASSGLSALKFVIAELSTYGSEGLNIDIRTSFPKLNLSVARLKLGKLAENQPFPPSFKLQSAENGLTIHRDTNVTVVGETNGQLLVSVSDSLRGDNCEFIALVGEEEVGNLLALNGYRLARNGQNGLMISQEGNDTRHQVQRIEDDAFIGEEIVPEMGAAFVDVMIDGADKIIAHLFPVVPFPDAGIFSSPTDPAALKYQASQDGRTVTAVDADNKTLAVAAYNPQKVNDPLNPDVKAWEWKEAPKPALSLTPSTITLEQAKIFLTGGEFLKKEDLKALEGRVFTDMASGAVFVVSNRMVDAWKAGGSKVGLSDFAANSEQAQTLAHFSNGKRLHEEDPRGWLEKWTPVSSNSIVLLDSTLAVILTPDLRPVPLAAVLTDRKISFPKQFEEDLRHRSGYFQVNWNEAGQQIQITDGYQIRSKFNSNNSSWEDVPLSEHQYLLTPEQQIQYIVNKLKTEKSTYNEPYKFDSYVVTGHQPQMVITVGGENGFTKNQAEKMRDWIDALLNGSSYAQEIFEVADVRFITKDNEGLSQLIGPGDTKYGSAPNDFNRSLWGIDMATYYPDDVWKMIPHEVARIYNEQVGKGLGNDPEVKKVETKLLENAPSFSW